MTDYKLIPVNEDLGVSRVDYDNGFVLYLIKSPRRRNASVRLRVNAGSANENGYPSGVSHFVEHILIDDELSRFFDYIAGDLNGETDLYYTDVYGTCKTIYISGALMHMHRTVKHFSTNIDAFDPEQHAITNEADKYEDNPEAWIENTMILPGIFRGTPLERGWVGKGVHYASIDRDAAYNFQRKWWVPNNMAMAIMGAIPNEDFLAEVVGKTFGTYESGQLPEPSPKIPLDKVSETLFEARRTRRVNFGMGWRVPRSSKDAPNLEILDAMISGNNLSLIRREIRGRKGLSYDPLSTYDDYGIGGAFYVTMGTSPRKFDEAFEITRGVFRSLAERATYSDFVNARKHAIAALEKRMDDLDEMPRMVLKNHFHNSRLNDVTRAEAALKRTTMDGVMETAQRYLDPDNFVLAAVGPEEVSEKLPGKA
ncbi:MAG: pitrilysin family protein [Nanoarchaeota archaeon]